MLDLHSHTTASDGTLSPEQLVALASEAGITMLAITDHDTMAGYLSIEQDFNQVNVAKTNCQQLSANQTNNIRLIAGVEVSCRHTLLGGYNKHNQGAERIIHVVGLDIQDTATMQHALQGTQISRGVRARQMVEKLAKLLEHDVEYLWQAVLKKVAGNANTLGRAHIAQVLNELGLVKATQEAFDKYLADGKPAYVAIDSPTMPEAVALIHRCGGLAVLAHPTHYGLSATRVRRLIADFAQMGGDGCELPSDSEPKSTRQMIDRAIASNALLVSVGSDFHGASMPWRKLGQVSTLNVGQTGVWERFRL